MIELYFDGGCWPNPGSNGKSGTIIRNEQETIYQGSNDLSGNVTNNLAEYDGLYQGLKILKERGLEKEAITVYGDSDMVIKQSRNGLLRLKPDKANHKVKPYKEIAFKVRDLLPDFSDISFQWIPREQNVEADLLTR